jgi:hypothetical protein
MKDDRKTLKVDSAFHSVWMDEEFRKILLAKAVELQRIREQAPYNSKPSVSAIEFKQIVVAFKALIHNTPPEYLKLLSPEVIKGRNLLLDPAHVPAKLFRTPASDRDYNNHKDDKDFIESHQRKWSENL